METKLYLELFFKTAIAEVQGERGDYLKKQKSVAFQQDLPEVDELSSVERAKLSFFARIRYRFYVRKARNRYKKALRAQKRPMDETLTKGYNAGIEHATKTFTDCFYKFLKKIEKEYEE